MDDTINAIKENVGENLVSVVSFGGEGVQKNILFILNKLGIDVLDSIRDIVVKHRKKTNVVPLLFTKDELMSGADVFPLEFLKIKSSSSLLYGEDVLSNIKFEKRHVRRQLEFELRSKRIHLRENYIWVKKSAELIGLLKAALPSMTTLLYGLLFVKDVNTTNDAEDMFRKVSDAYKIDMGVLEKVNKCCKGSLEELKGIAKELALFLDKLTVIVDGMKF